MTLMIVTHVPAMPAYFQSNKIEYLYFITRKEKIKTGDWNKAYTCLIHNYWFNLFPKGLHFVMHLQTLECIKEIENCSGISQLYQFKQFFKVKDRVICCFTFTHFHLCSVNDCNGFGMGNEWCLISENLWLWPVHQDQEILLWKLVRS